MRLCASKPVELKSQDNIDNKSTNRKSTNCHLLFLTKSVVTYVVLHLLRFLKSA